MKCKSSKVLEDSSVSAKMDSASILTFLLIFCASGAVQGFAPRNKLENPHIVGGEEAHISEVPYQVSIRRFLNHLCGASIIGKYYALTAAHCFHDRYWLIAYGVASGSDRVKEGSYKFIRSVMTHDKYVHQTSDYDVAVVRIWCGFKYDDRNTLPILIVDAEQKSEAGTKLVVSGWGKTSEFSDDISDKLRKAEVEVVDQSECEQIFDELTDRMFCAGVDDGSRDACNGDSGGPIVDIKLGLQVGVVSWGVGCGQSKRPGVYTDLSHHEIQKFIGNNVNKSFI